MRSGRSWCSGLPRSVRSPSSESAREVSRAIAIRHLVTTHFASSAVATRDRGSLTRSRLRRWIAHGSLLVRRAIQCRNWWQWCAVVLVRVLVGLQRLGLRRTRRRQLFGGIIVSIVSCNDWSKRRIDLSAHGSVGGVGVDDKLGGRWMERSKVQKSRWKRERCKLRNSRAGHGSWHHARSQQAQV